MAPKNFLCSYHPSFVALFSQFVEYKGIGGLFDLLKGSEVSQPFSIMSEDKKPVSAYLRFAAEVRPKLKEEHPDWTFGQLGKEVGKQWKELSEEEKRPYQEAYEAEKKEYDAAHPGDKKSKKSTKKCAPKTKKSSKKAKDAEEEDDEESD